MVGDGGERVICLLRDMKSSITRRPNNPGLGFICWSLYEYMKKRSDEAFRSVGGEDPSRTMVIHIALVPPKAPLLLL